MGQTKNQRSWAGGEISPDLYGRTDIQKYDSSAKTVRNFFVTKRGILRNDAGTAFIMPGKYPTKTTRSIPFKFSFNQEYLMVFGDFYVQFIKNGAPLFSTTQTLTTFTSGPSPTLTFLAGSNQGITSATIANGMMVRIDALQFPADATFAAYVNKRFFLISNVSIATTSTTFSLTFLDGTAVDSTNWGSSQASGQYTASIVLEVSTPYAYADLSLLNYAQSFDVVQLRHPSYIPQQLTRISDTSWSIGPTPYNPVQSPAVVALAGSAGAAGSHTYFYQVTTVDLLTGEESFPGCLFTASSTATKTVSAASQNGLLVTITTSASHTLTTGDVVVFSKTILSGTFPLVHNGVSYTVTVTSATTFTVTNGYSIYPPKTGNVLAETTIGVNGVSSANKITSITQAFPAVVTTAGNHGLNTGDSVLFFNTGVDGIDYQVFTITKVSNTTFSLNGINGAYYSLYSGSNGIVSSTTLSLVCAVPTGAAPNTLTWALSQFQTSQTLTNIGFNIYLNQGNGIFGFIGFSPTLAYSDVGTPPDPTKVPPTQNPLFIGTGNYPSACNYYQQRLIELATTNRPQGIFASQVGYYSNFSIHNPILSSDAIANDIASNSLSQLFGSVDAGFLVLMTDTGPFIVKGDQTGTLTPTDINVSKQVFAGASQLPRPLHVFKNILYMEANGQILRDLEVLTTLYGSYIQGSNEVSIYAGHMFNGHSISFWDYSQYPNSIVWMVRDDGKKIGFSYMPEQQMMAFHIHDTLGNYEDVAAVQEGTVTAVYDLVLRDVNDEFGNPTTGRSMERMCDRDFTDIKTDAIFTHNTVTYDGRITNGMGIYLTTATAWTFGSSITMHCNQNFFTSDHVGKQFNLRDDDGHLCRLVIQSITSAAVAVATPMELVNDAFAHGLVVTDIAICTNTVTGLWNLEGQQVSVFADGDVVSNPNYLSEYQTPVTVQYGTITLTWAYAVIHVGLPYLSDLATLDWDPPQAEDALLDKKMVVKRATFKLELTRDVWAGPNEPDPDGPATGTAADQTLLTSVKFRDYEGYLKDQDLFSGVIPVNIGGQYGYGGSLFIRNLQPTPITILNVGSYIDIQRTQ